MKNQIKGIIINGGGNNNVDVEIITDGNVDIIGGEVNESHDNKISINIVDALSVFNRLEIELHKDSEMTEAKINALDLIGEFKKNPSKITKSKIMELISCLNDISSVTSFIGTVWALVTS